MRTYVGHQELTCISEIDAMTCVFEDTETVAEDFRNLFVGEPDETASQAAARADVAREVLAELVLEGASDTTARMNAVYAALLQCTVPPRHARGEVCASVLEEAA